LVADLTLDRHILQEVVVERQHSFRVRRHPDLRIFGSTQ
jgi:hypothetical protein